MCTTSYIFCPFQGAYRGGLFVPRALPWAIVSLPVPGASLWHGNCAKWWKKRGLPAARNGIYNYFLELNLESL